MTDAVEVDHLLKLLYLDANLASTYKSALNGIGAYTAGDLQYLSNDDVPMLAFNGLPSPVFHQLKQLGDACKLCPACRAVAINKQQVSCPSCLGQPQQPPVALCSACNANPVNPGHGMCSSCHQAKVVTTTAGAVCQKCNSTPVNPGQPWCNNCHVVAQQLQVPTVTAASPSAQPVNPPPQPVVQQPAAAATPTPGYCSQCHTNPVHAGKGWCQQCYQNSKNGSAMQGVAATPPIPVAVPNQASPPQPVVAQPVVQQAAVPQPTAQQPIVPQPAAIPTPGYCSRCHTNPVHAGKGWCQQCYQNSKNGSAMQGVATAPPIPVAVPNQASVNPLPPQPAVAQPVAQQAAVPQPTAQHPIAAAAMPTPGYCSQCHTNPVNTGKSWCQQCYQKSKAPQYQANAVHAAIPPLPPLASGGGGVPMNVCKQCKTHPVNAGKSWCQQCYTNSKNPNFIHHPTTPTTAPPATQPTPQPVQLTPTAATVPTPAGMCTQCKVNYVNSGKSWCQQCYVASKNPQPQVPFHTSTAAPQQHVAVPAGICVKCKVNPVNHGKSWCHACYVASKAPAMVASTTTSTGPIFNNHHSAKLCVNCGVNTPNPGRSWCQPCFAQSKGGGSASVTTTTATTATSKGLCVNCNTNAPNAGKSWCQACFLNKGSSTGAGGGAKPNKGAGQKCGKCNTNPKRSEQAWCSACWLERQQLVSAFMSSNNGMPPLVCSNCCIRTPNGDKKWCTFCFGLSQQMAPGSVPSPVPLCSSCWMHNPNPKDLPQWKALSAVVKVFTPAAPKTQPTMQSWCKNCYDASKKGVTECIRCDVDINPNPQQFLCNVCQMIVQNFAQQQPGEVIQPSEKTLRQLHPDDLDFTSTTVSFAAHKMPETPDEHKCMTTGQVKVMSLPTPTHAATFTPEYFHYAAAESQFLRLTNGKYKVQHIELIIHPTCRKKYYAKMDEIVHRLKTNKIKASTEPIWVFHGTSNATIGKVCDGGFKTPEQGAKQVTDSGWYGRGLYFSDDPDYCLGYAHGTNKLILSWIFMGRIYECSTQIHGAPLQKGYDSHRCPQKKEYVIFDAAQTLPMYVITYH